MKMILLLLPVVLLYGCNVADFPTRPGKYEQEGWKYVYSISNKGSKSERRIGRLYCDGQEVTAPLGTVTNTPVGRFLLYPFAKNGAGWTQGWLNTLNYNAPVFKKDGALSEKAQRYVDNVRKTTEQSGGE